MSEWTEHKVPPYKITKMTNTSPEFYQLVGPYLSRREVVADLGAPVWDDAGKVWYVGISEAGEVLGMVAILKQTVCSFWVSTPARRHAVGYALLSYLMQRHPGKLEAVCTAASLPLFLDAGYKQLRERGKYHVCAYLPKTEVVA